MKANGNKPLFNGNREEIDQRGNTEMSTVISVSEFGAVGDGTTNDKASLLAAFSAAAGKTLVFEPNKHYLIEFDESTELKDREILIPSYTTVDLRGSIIEFRQDGPGYLFKLSNNVSIYNGTIQNTGGNTKSLPIGGYRQTILGLDVKNIIIRNIEFQNKEFLPTAAIALYGDVRNVLVENVHGGLPSGFQPLNQIFISHWWWKDVKFDMNELDTKDGRTTNHPRNIVIRNITAEGRINLPIYLSSSFNCKLQNIAFEAVRGITVYPGDYGQDLADSKFARKINRNIEIENVMITNCSEYGVRFTSYGGHEKSGYKAKPVTGNISLRSFTIVGEGNEAKEGVFASGATNARICDGTITSFQRGITLGQESYGTAIENVTINSCKTCGISVVNKPEINRSISITNCKIYNNNQLDSPDKKNSGIYLNNCSDIKIVNNAFGQISGGEKQYASVYSTNSVKGLYREGNYNYSARQSDFYIQDP